MGALFLFFFTGFIWLMSEQASRIFLLDEAGYGDSPILYDVIHFQKTGTIYRDPARPPYLPALYSPLVYILYSLPGRLTAWQNPFLGPRLVALTAFLACIVTAVSIARKLIPVRWVWLWGPLLAGSIGVMRDWALQLRGDIPGIFLSLLAVRLLMAGSPATIFLAGVCAGLAMQFKITFVAALVAGSIWLLVRERWKDMALFAASGAACSLGLYIFFWVREPRMLSQITAMSPGIPDVPGCAVLVLHALNEPLVVLALVAVSPIVWRTRSRWSLLALFAGTSFVVAGLTDIQAGGNINYFFETLFALIPVAVRGILRSLSWARRFPTVGMSLTALLLLQLVPLRMRDFSKSISEWRPQEVRSENTVIQMVEGALLGQRIFSAVPRCALLDTSPPLTEPYLLSYMQRLGKFNLRIIVERVHASEFDVVITPKEPQSWRGVPHIAPDLRAAIRSAYEPHCSIYRWLIHLPRGAQNKGPLIQRLAEIGCQPIFPGGLSVTSW
jgi:hypothetical protein